MVAPFAFGLAPAGMVAAVVLGAAIVGLALSLGDSGERGVLPLRAHHAYDLGLALGLLAGGLALGVSGDPRAFAVFAIAGIALVALTVNTRYSPMRA